jgi:hypothetical protein
MEGKENAISIFHCHSFHIAWKGIMMENIFLDITTRNILFLFSSNIRINISHIHLSKF